MNKYLLSWAAFVGLCLSLSGCTIDGSQNNVGDELASQTGAMSKNIAKEVNRKAMNKGLEQN